MEQLNGLTKWNPQLLQTRNNTEQATVTQLRPKEKPEFYGLRNV